MPVGFAHGFATLSDHCEVQYKQTGFYDPAAEGGIAWNDPEVASSGRITNSDSVQPKIKQPTLAEYRKQPGFSK